MSKLKYRITTAYLNKILLNDKSNRFTFLQDLHIQKINPEYAKAFNYKKISYINYFLINTINFIKVFLTILKIKKNILSNNKLIDQYDNIFICHLNKNDQIKKIDSTHFGKFVSYSSKKNRTLRVFIDHRKNKSIIKFKSKNNFILNSNITIKNKFRILLLLIKSFYRFKLFLKINNFTNLELNKNLLNSVISTTSFINNKFYFNFHDLIKKYKPKNIIITFEGHCYERMIMKAVNESRTNINLMSYPHGSIDKSQNSIFLKLNKQIMPSKIICPGKITYNYFIDKKFDKKKLFVIGSDRSVDFINNKSDSGNVLLIPDGSNLDTVMLFDLSLKLAHIFINNRFYFKPHPFFNNNYNKNNLKLPDNLIISDNFNLKYFSTKCSKVIFRGSAAVIECINYGMYPYFYNCSDFSNNILFKFDEKISFKSVQEFSDLSLSDDLLNKIKVFANNYYLKQNKNAFFKLLI